MVESVVQCVMSYVYSFCMPETERKTTAFSNFPLSILCLVLLHSQMNSNLFGRFMIESAHDAVSVWNVSYDSPLDT